MDLKQQRCAPCEGGTQPLNRQEADALLKEISGWSLNTAGQIERTFEFKNFYQTMAFVNAVAWVAHREDHHPTMEVGYKQCRVRYSTHAIKGLSRNDFICAAKLNELNG